MLYKSAEIEQKTTLYLLRFNFTLKYISRIKIEKIDELSKRLDQKVRVENNNDNQVFIKNYWICNLSEVIIKGQEIDILEKIKITRSKNEEVVKIIEKMKKAE